MRPICQFTASITASTPATVSKPEANLSSESANQSLSVFVSPAMRVKRSPDLARVWNDKDSRCR